MVNARPAGVQLRRSTAGGVQLRQGVQRIINNMESWADAAGAPQQPDIRVGGPVLRSPRVCRLGFSGVQDVCFCVVDLHRSALSPRHGLAGGRRAVGRCPGTQLSSTWVVVSRGSTPMCRGTCRAARPQTQVKTSESFPPTRGRERERGRRCHFGEATRTCGAHVLPTPALPTQTATPGTWAGKPYATPFKIK